MIHYYALLISNLIKGYTTGCDFITNCKYKVTFDCLHFVLPFCL